MKILQNIALVIIIIGAINWGLMGIFDFNLFGFLFNNINEWISRILYILVGLAGIIAITSLFTKKHDFD